MKKDVWCERGEKGEMVKGFECWMGLRCMIDEVGEEWV